MFPEIHQLMHEHGVLLRCYAALQQRCTAQAQEHQHEMLQLQAVVTRLRAQLIARETALHWEREDRRQQLAAVAMHSAVQAVRSYLASAPTPTPTAAVSVPSDSTEAWTQPSQLAAELVICQTGCISHGSPWRHDEQCTRTGNACLLPSHVGAQPTPIAQAVRIVAQEPG